MIVLLECKGMLERQQSAHDRRAFDIRPAEGGQRPLDSCDRRVARLEEEMFAALDADDPGWVRKRFDTCIATLDAMRTERRD
jgi:DNA-binding MarR family transcriptional regulator